MPDQQLWDTGITVALPDQFSMFQAGGKRYKYRKVKVIRTVNRNNLKKAPAHQRRSNCLPGLPVPYRYSGNGTRTRTDPSAVCLASRIPVLVLVGYTGS